MSNSLVLNLPSNHSGSLVSLISKLPYLNHENVAGKSAAVIRSVSSTVLILSTMKIGFVVSEWYDFHQKFFPSEFSFSFVVLSIVVLSWFVCYCSLFSVGHDLGFCSQLIL